MDSSQDSWQQRRLSEDLRDVRRLVEDMVPRAAHEQRWKADDFRFDSLASGQAGILEALNGLKENRVPAWLWGLAGPVLAVIAAHLLR